jgi:hypothetical protein
MTSPSRLASKGRGVACSSPGAGEVAYIESKRSKSGTESSSHPPAIMTVCTPARIASAAYPIPWLAEVQALEVGMMRPVRPKKMPMFAAQLWLIACVNALACIPRESRSMQCLAMSRSMSLPARQEPYATPARPEVSTGLPRSPESTSAISEARVAMSPARLMLRMRLRV